MQPSDEIWNRATVPLPPEARRGDRALHDALELHGYVMNGGLEHGLEVMGAETARAAAGWAYLGREDIAALLREALRTVGDMPADPNERQRFFVETLADTQAEQLERLGQRYVDDDALEQAFLRTLDERPEDFAPV